MKKKLLVLGGTGFLGSAVCRRASERGWEVVSLSRNGRPRDALQRAYRVRPAGGIIPARTLQSPVHYLAYDVLAERRGGDAKKTEEDARVLEHVADCTAVVHCMGTIMESEAYKRVAKAPSLQEAVSAATGCAASTAMRLGMQLQQRGASGLATDALRAATTPSPQPPLSNQPNAFERWNRDSAYRLLQLTARHLPHARCFLYVSAAEHMLPWPLETLGVPDARYLRAKREVERVLAEGVTVDGERMDFDRVVLRPGFMHSDEHTLTQPISATLAVMHAVKTQLLPEGLQRVLPAPPARPLHVQAVASAIVDCAEHSLLASAAGRAGGSAQSVSASDDDNDETRHVTNFRTLEVDDMLALSTCA